jgi:xylulokinase
MTILIGLDLGTTSIKALAYDPDAGIVRDIIARPTPIDHPRPDWSEHDPEALWSTAAACLREVAGRHAGKQIAGIGVSSFAEAGLPLDANGSPLYPVIAWFDRRSEPQAAWWEEQFTVEQMHAITGQRVSPSFGVNKYMWIRDNVPGAADRMATWLSVPDYILWRLSGERATDYTIASRTMLFDQGAQTWSAPMLDRAGLRRDQLPTPYPGGTAVGGITPEASAATGLPVGTPCVLGGHDHLVAAVAAGGTEPGIVIDSSGTAQAVLVLLSAFHTDARIARSGYACYSHVLPGRYALKAGLKLAGGAVEWLARRLAGIDAGDDLPYEALEAAATSTIGRDGPVWLPHLIGSGTPEADRHSRAALVGLTPDHDAGDLFRALLESLAFWLRHNLETIARLTDQPAGEIVVLGGANRLDLLARLKATALHRPVTRLDLPEAAATGAALLAGIGSGVFDSPADAASSLCYDRVVVEPLMRHIAHYDHIYEAAYLPLYETLRGVHHTLAGR